MTGINKFKAVGMEVHQVSESSSTTKTSGMGSLKSQIANTKAQMAKTEQDVDTKYDVKGGSDSGISKAEEIAGIITAFGSAAAQVLQALGNNGQTNVNPGETKSSSGLDKATAGYQKDSSAKNERTLKMNLDKATFDKSTLDNQIKKITTQEPLLQQAVKGDFEPIMDNIQEGIKDTQNTILEKNNQVAKLDKGIDSLTDNIQGNREATIKAENLSDEAKEIFDIKGEEVTIRLTEEAKEKDTLTSVKAKVDEYEGKVSEDNTNIDTCTDKLGEAKNNQSEKSNALADAKSNLDNTDKEITDKDGKKTKNPDYAKNEQAYKKAEKELEEANKAVEKAEKELEKAKEQKEKDYEKLMEHASLVQVGETNLADIIQARNTAENERDRAKLDQQDYASQAIALAGKDDKFNAQLDALKAEQKDTQKTKSTCEVDLSNMKTGLKDSKDKQKAAKRVAEQQLAFNNDALSDLRTASNRLDTSIKNANAALASKAGASAQPTDGKTDAKPADGKTDAKPADGKTDAKPADGKTDAKPADGKTDAKPADGKTDAKPADGKTDTKPAGDNTGTIDKNSEDYKNFRTKWLVDNLATHGNDSQAEIDKKIDEAFLLDKSKKG